MKVLICLSRWEGCSTIISESIQSKKPFLSLHCPGVSEFCVNGLNEKSFFSNSMELSNYLQHINYKFLNEIANELFLHFYSDFSIEKNMTKWDNLLK